jgi:hypothetical protein
MALWISILDISKSVFRRKHHGRFAREGTGIQKSCKIQDTNFPRHPSIKTGIERASDLQQDVC